MNLHVVANLDRTILRAHSPARRLRTLKAHLDACPGFVLTLFTSQPFQRVKNLLLDGLGGQPRHVVTDDGDSSLVISAALGLSGSHPAIQRLVDLLGNIADRSASLRHLELNPVQYRERVVS